MASIVATISSYY